jgi:hypothetical protein
MIWIQSGKSISGHHKPQTEEPPPVGQVDGDLQTVSPPRNEVILRVRAFLVNQKDLGPAVNLACSSVGTAN